eukprot:SAG11_NODE_1564_length_4675_cov_2.781687_1_plen_22_part_10
MAVLEHRALQQQRQVSSPVLPP